jgi:hypothetical protein
MTVHFTVPTSMGRRAVGQRGVSSATELEELVNAIAELPERSVVIHHAGRPVTGNVFFDDGVDVYDHELVAAVHGDWGYAHVGGGRRRRHLDPGRRPGITDIRE